MPSNVPQHSRFNFALNGWHENEINVYIGYSCTQAVYYAVFPRYYAVFPRGRRHFPLSWRLSRSRLSIRDHVLCIQAIIRAYRTEWRRSTPNAFFPATIVSRCSLSPSLSNRFAAPYFYRCITPPHSLRVACPPQTNVVAVPKGL